MRLTDVVMMVALSGSDNGHLETVITVVAAVVVGGLLLVGLALGVARRISALVWLGGAIAATFAAMTVLS